MAKIFLDAGHGGHDPGAIGSKSKEKDNALKVVLALGKYLKELGHSVKYSRTTDKYLTLTQRANLANAWGADIFISAHNNAATASATGFETYIYNGSISANTKKVQNSVHGAIAKEIGIRDRGKKRANFAVVRQTRMPAILIEYAFVTNKNDEKILINQVDKLARLTANGVADYYGQKHITDKKDGDLDVSAEKRLQKQIDSLERKLNNKVDKYSEGQDPWPSHKDGTAFVKASGISDGRDPHKPVTREQIFTLLLRFYEKIIKPLKK